MIRNLLLTSIRNFRSNLSYATFNVVGLSIGMGCCLVVYTIVSFEHSFDQWHEKKDQVFRYTNIYHEDGDVHKNGIVPYPTGDVLAYQFPEIESVVEFHGPTDYKVSFTNSTGESKVFRENEVLMTSGNFFEVLDFDLLSGNPKDLDEPNKMFLSEDLATKYFEGENAIGKVLNIEIEGKNAPVQVVGVVKNPPQNTSLPYTALLSIATLKRVEPEFFTTWTMTWAYSAYVRVQADADIVALNKKIDRVIDETRGRSKESSELSEVVLQPLTEIHTDESYGSGYHYVLPSQMIWALVLLASLILATGCLNFVNLSTALAFKRSKEIGIRKVLGSTRRNLVLQFMSETLLITFASWVIAMGLSQMLLDKFTDQFSPVTYLVELSFESVLASLALILMVTLIAGMYPSLILSGYKPLDAIKNRITLSKGAGSFNFRRSLIVAQFTFTILMIVSTLVVSSQVKEMKQRDLGFTSENVMLIPIPFGTEQGPRTFLNALEAQPYVKSSTLAFTAPSSWWNQSSSFELIGTSSDRIGGDANMKFIDANYIDFYEIPLIAGRNITEQYLNDSTFNCLVTKKTVTTLGLSMPEEAIGKTLSVGGEQLKYKVSGVVEDFSVSSSQDPITPVILAYDPREMYMAAIKLSKGNYETHLQEAEQVFRAQFPNELFEHSLLSQEINQRYAMEDLLLVATSFISVITIVLACIGLYGLVAFMAARNTKSIGIRKVFGASTASILRMFSMEYIGLLILSFMIAAPMAYWLLNSWMEGFAYRISLSPKYFGLGFIIAILIAVVTVGYRSLLAAKANPIKALRYE